MWGHKKMMRLIAEDRVVQAIQQAETRTSGEIRVSVSPFFLGSIKKVAHKAFRRLGMAATKERNGILIFVVPARKRFYIHGDEGIHAKVGQDFWDKIAAAMSGHFRQGDFTTGLVRGIEAVGEQLAAYFPYDAAGDVNELPDAIDYSRNR
jgi:uncharacterized membrane protein